MHIIIHSNGYLYASWFVKNHLYINIVIVIYILHGI